MGEWIRFSEKMPSKACDSESWSDRVLVYQPSIDDKPEYIYTSPICFSVGNGRATHWMPLPDPPQD